MSKCKRCGGSGDLRVATAVLNLGPYSGQQSRMAYFGRLCVPEGPIWSPAKPCPACSPAATKEKLTHE